MKREGESIGEGEILAKFLHRKRGRADVKKCVGFFFYG
jgi:hypothetical protein